MRINKKRFLEVKNYKVSPVTALMTIFKKVLYYFAYLSIYIFFIFYP